MVESEEGEERGSENREGGMGGRHCYFWMEVGSTEEFDWDGLERASVHMDGSDKPLSLLSPTLANIKDYYGKRKYVVIPAEYGKVTLAQGIHQISSTP